MAVHNGLVRSMAVIRRQAVHKSRYLVDKWENGQVVSKIWSLATAYSSFLTWLDIPEDPHAYVLRLARKRG